MNNSIEQIIKVEVTWHFLTVTKVKIKLITKNMKKVRNFISNQVKGLLTELKRKKTCFVCNKKSFATSKGLTINSF